MTLKSDTSLQKLVEFCRNHSQGLFMIALFLGVAMHLITLPYSPVPWIDEAHITEIARGGIGVKTTDWSVDMPIEGLGTGKLTGAPYWLGGYVNEIGYQLLGESGARYLMLTFLVLGTIALYVYAKKKTNSDLGATLVALLYFSHPILTQSARGGRVDAMAFMVLFLALLVLQSKPKTRLGLLFAPIAVSLFSIVAVFTWITSCVLMPIVLWEVLDFFKREHFTWRQRSLFLIVASISGLCFVSIIGAPFLAHYKDIPLYVERIRSGVSGPQAENHSNLPQQFVRMLLSPPYVVLLGSILLATKRRFAILLAGLGAFILVNINSRIYSFRFLYFLPYACMGIVLFLACSKSAKVKKIVGSALLLMLMFSYGRSVLVRNITESFAQRFRDTAYTKQILEREIGRNVNVYVGTYELYYIGRDLGWKQYRYDFEPLSTTSQTHVENCDFIIIKAGSNQEKVAENFIKCGFSKKATIDVVPNSYDNLGEKFLYKLGRLSPLGPYVLFARNP